MTRSRRAVRIGGGAGFAGDRIEPAVDLVCRGSLDYLVLECLGERTIALAQLQRLRDPATGYDRLLERRLTALLAPLVETRTRLVTNAGSANPLAAAALVAEVAARLGLGVDVAAVTGDDVLAVLDLESPAWEDGRPLAEHGEIVSANAYIGAAELLPALETGARVVVAGRAADPSLCVAPLLHEIGGSLEDWGLLATFTMAGHLLECAGQVTGGYYADPPAKVVPALANLGFPIARVTADGALELSKLAGSGGIVDFHSVAEQLTYEVEDPSGYVTPDVVLDITAVGIDDLGDDRVLLEGARGRQRPELLKVSVGYRAGFRCEGEISYAGRSAVSRARLAGEVVSQRLAGRLKRLRVDLVGLSSIHGEELAEGREPYECRLRVATVAASREEAEVVGDEVMSLYTNGPAGGGGIRVHIDEVIGVLSSSVPREAVRAEVTYRAAS